MTGMTVSVGKQTVSRRQNTVGLARLSTSQVMVFNMFTCDSCQVSTCDGCGKEDKTENAVHLHIFPCLL